MGCDYYITKVLCIYHTDGIYTIELSREKGYILSGPDLDSDDERYHEECKRYNDAHLIVRYNPILIYEKGAFLRDDLKHKYRKDVEEAIGQKAYGDEATVKSMADIIKICKEERRFWR